MKDDYGRSISLQCPTCGGESFEHDEDKPDIKCVRCERTMTKDELREANGARIEEEVETLKAEVFKDVKADISKMLKKWK